MTFAVNLAQGASNNTTFRNRIINGAMLINQRGWSGTITTDGTYTLDRWQAFSSAASKYSVAQSSTAPAGFINSILVTSLAATSVGATDYYFLRQCIEGLNCTDLGFGAVGASTVTLSFWVRSSLTGTFGGTLENSAQNRSYPFSYTISSANTWEQKSIIVAGDTTGTWLTTNGIGIMVQFGLGVGSTYSDTANAWTSKASAWSATGATSVVGTNGATFYITGCQLEAGSSASPFEYRQYGTELALCQRYYYKYKATDSSTMFGSGFCYSGTQALGTIKFAVTMRTTPTALEQNGTAGDYKVLLTGSSPTCTGVPTFDGAGVESADVQFNLSGLTSGQGLFLRASNSNAYLAWSAEL